MKTEFILNCVRKLCHVLFLLWSLLILFAVPLQKFVCGIAFIHDNKMFAERAFYCFQISRIALRSPST